jgi:hypothetical protein
MYSMSDDLFREHVTENRNDFARWINDVFEESELALLLDETRSKQEMYKTLKKYFNK